jgi:hypothetical protein
MPRSVNKIQSKWCINKHGASKIIDTFEMYHTTPNIVVRPTVGVNYCGIVDTDATRGSLREMFDDDDIGAIG